MLLAAASKGLERLQGCLPVSMGLLPVSPIYLATCFTPSPCPLQILVSSVHHEVGLPSGCHSASLITSHENWAVPGMEVRAGTMGRGMREACPVVRLAHSEGKQESVAGQIPGHSSCSTRGEGLLRASATTSCLMLKARWPQGQDKDRVTSGQWSNQAEAIWPSASAS